MRQNFAHELPEVRTITECFLKLHSCIVIQLPCQTTLKIPQSFVVCQQHYPELNRRFTAPKCCACCGAKPKFRNPFVTRYMKTDHLQENMILQDGVRMSHELFFSNFFFLSFYESMIFSLFIHNFPLQYNVV